MLGAAAALASLETIRNMLSAIRRPSTALRSIAMGVFLWLTYIAPMQQGIPRSSSAVFFCVSSSSR